MKKILNEWRKYLKEAQYGRSKTRPATNIKDRSLTNIEKLKEKLKEKNKTPDEIEALIKEFMSSAYYNLKVRDFKQANKVDFMKALY